MQLQNVNIKKGAGIYSVWVYHKFVGSENEDVCPVSIYDFNVDIRVKKNNFQLKQYENKINGILSGQKYKKEQIGHIMRQKITSLDLKDFLDNCEGQLKVDFIIQLRIKPEYTLIEENI